MSAAMYPGEISDLLWHFNEAEGEIKRLRSTFPDETRLKALGEIGEVRGVEVVGERRYNKSGLWCGAIEPNETPPSPPTTEISEQAVAAAARDRKIMNALSRADDSAPHSRWTCAQPPSTVLRLCFREPLATEPNASRLPFGLFGAAGERNRPMTSAMGVRLNPLRGPGNLAHLVESAVTAYAVARTQLDIIRWVDRLGARLQHGKASPQDRELQRAVINEAEALELRALELYRRGMVRVPLLVQRRARNAA